MKIKDIAKKLTKKEFVEFLDEIDIISDGCPSDLGLRENNVISNCGGSFCKECWNNAFNDLKFNDDFQEENVIEALKVINRYCENRDCSDCKFIDSHNHCMFKYLLLNSPYNWAINMLENHIKPQTKIYEVEHKQNSKKYNFISDEDLSRGDIVVCDTKYGKSYGKIICVRTDVNNGFKKCWKVK